MRRIFAIVFIIMFALILLSPTMGYSVQTGNHSYTIKSARLNYTIGIETPSREPLVLVNKKPYSLKYEDLFQPEAKQIGETAKSIVIGKSTSAHMVTPVQTKTPVAMTVQRKFFIQGMVFNDQNGNGKIDNNETGLADRTVNLEQPSGNVISKLITNNSGEYSFYELMSGKYIVAAVSNIGWSITSPLDGMYAVNLTNNVTGLNFGNEMMPQQMQNTTVPSDVTSSFNVASQENASTLK
jgi:uncharacterized protein (DUF2141 family)